MADPAKQLESLLRLHGFKVVRETKHLVYKNPQGKIFVTSKTPSDWRAQRNMLTELRYVIANPAPPSELIEEQRQRRKLEADIRLTITVKPLDGMSGAGKGHKSKGIGIFYFDSDEGKSLEYREKKARERADRRAWMESPEGLAWRAAEKARKREEEERESLRREWVRQLARFKRQREQFDDDLDYARNFFCVMQVMQTARDNMADFLRQNRKSGGWNDPEARRAGLDEMYVQVTADCGKDEALYDKITGAAKTFMGTGLFLLLRSGRAPKWLSLDEGEFDRDSLTAFELRMLRRTVAWVSRYKIEGSLGWVNPRPAPEWLANGIKSLHVGKNTLED